MQNTPIRVVFLDKMGMDVTVVNAARVSFDTHHDEFINGTDDKLLDFLAREDHWSPFAHCFLQFRIRAPLFVARQLVKHQIGLAWNEVSRRYVVKPPEFYFPEEWRGKPANAKQGSSDEVIDIDPKVVMDHAQSDVDMYRFLLDKGVAPEQARMVLPVNMMTEWWWSGSLMAFARVCNQRMKPNAQKETARVAYCIDQSATHAFPFAWDALRKPRE